MSDLKVNALLSELNRMAALVNKPADQGMIADTGNDFASVLKDTLKGVNDSQQTAAEMARAFELGDDKVDLAEVMINLQKSRLHFQSTLQVRNKLIAAYQDIMNMPL